jgi:translocation protein SEC63
LLREVQPILTALLNISLAHNWLATSLHCISLQPALVQALPPSVSPLAQLPGISPEQGFEQQVTNSAEGKRWLEKWVKADVEGCEEAKRVARSWPRLEIVSAEFKGKYLYPGLWFPFGALAMAVVSSRNR